MDWRRAGRRAARAVRSLTTPVHDGPGWATDAAHGPVLVTPVDPAVPGSAYRVESQHLGVLELRHEQRTVHGPGLVGVLRPSDRIGRRSADDVRVGWGEHLAHFRQTSRWGADLVVDGRRVARFQRTGSTDRRADTLRAEYVVTWDHPVPPEVALLGHALASRYCPGAPAALTRVVNGF